MFKMVKTLTAWWPVKVYEPAPDKAGTFAEHSFEIEFEIIDRDQVETHARQRAAIFDDADGQPSAVQLREIERKLEEQQIKEFQRCIRNWRGVLDDAGEVFPFTNENLLIALRRNSIREGIRVAYGEAVDTGKARLGN